MSLVYTVRIHAVCVYIGSNTAIPACFHFQQKKFLLFSNFSSLTFFFHSIYILDVLPSLFFFNSFFFFNFYFSLYLRSDSGIKIRGKSIVFFFFVPCYCTYTVFPFFFFFLLCYP